MKKNIFKILSFCITAAVISFIVVGCDNTSNDDTDTATEETALDHAGLHVDPNYVCPMHSQITDTKPSSCSICGMDLELRDISEKNENLEGIFVSAAMVNNLGVRLEHVEIGQVSEEVYASGFVETVSVAREEDINSRVSGHLLGIAVQIGQWVEEGDVLITIEVADYYDSLIQYIDSMENAQIAKALKLREKLLAMGVGDEVLAGYDQDRPLAKNLEIVAPFSGEITWVLDNTVGDKSNIGASNIEIGARLVQVTAPSLAEVDLRSYSRVARGVKVGRTGKLGITHLPGRTWPGRVVEVIHNRAGFYSALRFHVKIPSGVLEPGAFAGAYVQAGTVENVVRVPTSAVIYDEDSTRVIRLRDDESFEAVKIELGFEGHKWIEVVSGLQKGDHVVTRGQFLIDSEATLQAGFKRLSQD